jgi:branched-chain amino acid transport system permease protein
VISLIGLSLVALLALWLVINAVKTPSLFFDVMLAGVTNGAVYGLIALGYTLVYGILQLINFAHGDLFAMSSLFASTVLVSVFGMTETSASGAIALAIAGTLVIAMAFGATVNVTVELIGYRRLRKAPRLAPLITAVGMAFILDNISLLVWGVDYKSTPRLISNAAAFAIGGVSFEWNKLIVLGITAPVLAGLTWLVKSTRQGKAMRATSQDPDASAMMGINVNRTISFTFALAGALAGAGGVLYVLEFTTTRYDLGFQLGLIAFTAAVLGGIGNLTGAVVGALVIGLIEQFNEGLTWHSPGSDWTHSIVFGILILILVFRPEGLLGARTPEGA